MEPGAEAEIVAPEVVVAGQAAVAVATRAVAVVAAAPVAAVVWADPVE